MTTSDTRRWRIRVADWDDPTDRAALQQIRREVFIVEQQVPEVLEWDDDDASAIHLLALDRDNEEPVGTARILSSGQIGRMAVRKPWRARGIGKALLTAAIEQCRQPPFVHAQVQAIPFYTALGFTVTGETFIEAGIRHRLMQFSR